MRHQCEKIALPWLTYFSTMFLVLHVKMGKMAEREMTFFHIILETLLQRKQQIPRVRFILFPLHWKKCIFHKCKNSFPWIFTFLKTLLSLTWGYKNGLEVHLAVCLNPINLKICLQVPSASTLQAFSSSLLMRYWKEGTEDELHNNDLETNRCSKRNSFFIFIHFFIFYTQIYIHFLFSRQKNSLK